MGSSDPQTAFDVLIELSDRDGGHAINDITGGSDCANANEGWEMMDGKTTGGERARPRYSPVTLCNSSKNPGYDTPAASAPWIVVSPSARKAATAKAIAMR